MSICCPKVQLTFTTKSSVLSGKFSQTASIILRNISLADSRNIIPSLLHFLQPLTAKLYRVTSGKLGQVKLFTEYKLVLGKVTSRTDVAAASDSHISVPWAHVIT